MSALPRVKYWPNKLKNIKNKNIVVDFEKMGQGT